MSDAANSKPVPRTCPECDGEMYAESDDRYCLECIHEGRV